MTNAQAFQALKERWPRAEVLEWYPVKRVPRAEMWARRGGGDMIPQCATGRGTVPAMTGLVRLEPCGRPRLVRVIGEVVVWEGLDS